MKKALLISVVLLVFTLPVMAGPMLGLQVVPTVGSNVGFVAGWNFNYANVVIKKDNLSSVYGNFSIAGIVTPVSDGFRYRGGVNVNLHWDKTKLQYRGLSFIVGVQKTWNVFSVYGDLNISSTGVITPVLGINIIFDWFGPRPEQS